MILVTLGFVALLQAAPTLAAPVAASAPAPVPEPAVASSAQPVAASAQGRPEVVCEARPRTGSRFTRQRCQSRDAMEAHARESRRFAEEMTRGTAAELPDGPR